MVCPTCNSSDLKKLSLIHAAGSYELRGSLLGALIGSGGGLLFGSYRVKSQNLLCRMAATPRKMHFISPDVLVILKFFKLMALSARGNLSCVLGTLSISYV